VGGDWYDSFTTENGSTLLVVGDVAGHDGDATANMAQLRNLLRGLALGGDSGPAALLGKLDRAIRALGLDVIATVVIAEVPTRRSDRAAEDGLTGRVLRWASAGHLPLLVRSSDGDVRIPAGGADLLLGADPTVERNEYITEFPAGSAAILYTDGLIERRDRHLDEGLAMLVAACRESEAASADSLCKGVVHSLIAGPPDDDVVVLVARSREHTSDLGDRPT
jgi:chemotaxis family two-component system sensor kinase Cph1